MSILVEALNAVELWWWQLPNYGRWFFAMVPTAILIGLAGGVFS